MEIFLIASSLLFLVFGAMLLLAPETIEKISKATNQGLFFIDDHIHAWRRPIGIFFLALCIFLWYVAWWKGRL